MQSHEFPIGVSQYNNPLVNSIFATETREGQIAPGPPLFITTDDGTYITTDDGIYITTG